MLEIRTPRDAEQLLSAVDEFHDMHIASIRHLRSGDVEVAFAGAQRSIALALSGDVSYCAAADAPEPWHNASIHFQNGFIYLVDNSLRPGCLPADPGCRYRWFRARHLSVHIEASA